MSLVFWVTIVVESLATFIGYNCSQQHSLATTAANLCELMYQFELASFSPKEYSTGSAEYLIGNAVLSRHARDLRETGATGGSGAIVWYARHGTPHWQSGSVSTIKGKFRLPTLIAKKRRRAPVSDPGRRPERSICTGAGWGILLHLLVRGRGRGGPRQDHGPAPPPRPPPGC